MARRPEFHTHPTQRVYDVYAEICNSDLILNKSINEKNIIEFQLLLNKSQPADGDLNNRLLIQYLYRKNPTNFCRFLIRSKLSHLILWTESKCIVRHFGLGGVVYIKWNDNKYECSLHNNVNNNLENNIREPQSSKQKTYVSNNRDFGNYTNSRGLDQNYNYNRRSHIHNQSRGDVRLDHRRNNRDVYRHRDVPKVECGYGTENTFSVLSVAEQEQEQERVNGIDKHSNASSNTTDDV